MAAEVCEVCEQPYGVWFAPSDVWNTAMRVGDAEAHSFICPRCFTLAAEDELEGITGWLVTPCNDGPVRLASQVVIRGR